LRRKTHRTIKTVTEDIEKDFHFNTAISTLMELVNETYAAIDKGADKDSVNEALKALVMLMSPFVPHIAEELWLNLGNKPPLVKAPWPKHDEGLIKQTNVTIVIQVNGKVRSKVDVPSDTNKDLLKDLVFGDDKVKRWLEGKSVKDFIVVPNKIVNIVVS